MGGNLSIEQIIALSGESERRVKKDLSKGILLDQTPESVGEWLKTKIHDRISKPNRRVGIRNNRQPTVHRKWD